MFRFFCNTQINCLNISRNIILIMKLRSRLIRRLNCFGSVKATICTNINLSVLYYLRRYIKVNMFIVDRGGPETVYTGREGQPNPGQDDSLPGLSRHPGAWRTRHRLPGGPQ